MAQLRTIKIVELAFVDIGASVFAGHREAVVANDLLHAHLGQLSYVLVTSALVRTYRVVAFSSARAGELFDLAFVDVFAGFPVVPERKPFGAKAKCGSDRVEARVGAVEIFMLAFVDILARVIVSGQLSANDHARALVASGDVNARVLARPVSVVQQALVFVEAVFAIDVQTIAVGAAARMGSRLVSANKLAASVVSLAFVDIFAGPVVFEQRVSGITSAVQNLVSRFA